MLVFAMDQLIVLKGVRVHSASVLKGEDNKIWDNKWGREKAEKGKKKNKVTTN